MPDSKIPISTPAGKTQLIDQNQLFHFPGKLLPDDLRFDKEVQQIRKSVGGFFYWKEELNYRTVAAELSLDKTSSDKTLIDSYGPFLPDLILNRLIIEDKSITRIIDYRLNPYSYHLFSTLREQGRKLDKLGVVSQRSFINLTSLMSVVATSGIAIREFNYSVGLESWEWSSDPDLEDEILNGEIGDKLVKTLKMIPFKKYYVEGEYMGVIMLRAAQNNDLITEIVSICQYILEDLLDDEGMLMDDYSSFFIPEYLEAIKNLPTILTSNVSKIEILSNDGYVTEIVPQILGKHELTRLLNRKRVSTLKDILIRLIDRKQLNTAILPELIQEQIYHG